MSFLAIQSLLICRKMKRKQKLEVRHEDEFFHWVTNRALRQLIEWGDLESEWRKLSFGGNIHLVWHKSNRYYRREAKKVIELVEEYSAPNVAGAIGLHGEAMALDGFARLEFVLKGRNTKSYKKRVWKKSEHDLDFIFEGDSIAYGIEVKNMLGYPEYGDIEMKINICKHLGLKPVFVVRMVPKSWIYEIQNLGGFTLVLKYQLYPWSYREMVRRVREGLGLPVDSPRALADGTLQRFRHWHMRKM